MAPAPAAEIATIKAADLCSFAVRSSGTVPFSEDEALIALGAVSNLYCHYAMANPQVTATTFRGFISEQAASKRAVLEEIRRSVPGIDVPISEAILDGLSRSLDHIVTSRAYQQVRLPGFGVLQAVCAQRSEYSLTFELPLAQFLEARRRRQSESEMSAGG